MRVLLLENEPLIARALCRHLSQLGYTVDLCPSAAAAVAQIRRSPPAAAVLDVDLGGAQTGVDLMLELLRAHPGTPYAFFTGASPAALARLLMERGIEADPPWFAKSAGSQKLLEWLQRECPTPSM